MEQAISDALNVAEVLNTVATRVRDTPKVIVGVRMLRGGFKRGPARLICRDGGTHAMTILGFGMISPLPSDLTLVDLMLDGVSISLIEPGQHVLQDDVATV